MMKGKTGGFGINNHHIVAEYAKIGALSRLSQLGIPFANTSGRAIAYESLQGFAHPLILFFHRIKPIIYYGVRQIIPLKTHAQGTNMLNDICYGTYARFNTASRDEGFTLLGADNLVGDIYTIEVVRTENNTYEAWLVNRFGKRVGFLAEEYVHKVQTFIARGWTLRALLSFVSMDKESEMYWGEVALLFNDPHYNEEFDVFAQQLGITMGEGVRPDIDFTEQAARKVVDSKGAWQPADRVPIPKEAKKGLVKDRRSASEKMIEQGRAGNKGCYAATWVFWAALAVAVVFGALKFFGVM